MAKWTADLGNGMYKNPVLFADYSDPDVVRAGDDFFMTASSFSYFPGLPILHSKDLVNWRIVGHAAKKLPFACYDKPQHGKGIWAPSIRCHNGWFFITFSTPDEGICITKTKDPFGEWEEVRLLKEAKGWIDPCPFWDDDGRAYLVHTFARSRCGIKSMLRLCEMSPAGDAMSDEGCVVYDGRIYNPTIEGPKLYKRNAYYYIFAPAGGVTNGWQTVLRAKHIQGPYESRVVMRQNDTAVNGPHQGGLVELPDGTNFFLHFQDAGGYGRITHLQPVVWERDWPVIGRYNKQYNVGEPVIAHQKPVASNEIITPATDDDFSAKILGLQWQWQAHENKNYHAFCENGLRLFAVPVSTGLLCDAPAVLTQLVQAPECSVTAEMMPRLAAPGDCAGICVTGGNYYMLKLQRVDEKCYLIQAQYEWEQEKEPEEEIVDIVSCDALAEKLFLKVEISPGFMMRFFYSEDGAFYNEIGAKKQYQVNRNSWVGGKIGLFCMNQGKTESEGFTDFVRIKIE